jgi:hypothetical protein
MGGDVMQVVKKEGGLGRDLSAVAVIDPHLSPAVGLPQYPTDRLPPGSRWERLSGSFYHNFREMYILLVVFLSFL